MSGPMNRPSDKKIGDFEPTVVITEKEYRSLLYSDQLLACLEAHGVDNWSGYEDALEEAEKVLVDTDIMYSLTI